jgi:threonine/homoserine/homoserine lactone efflux protein
MEQLVPILLAALTGFVSGLALCVPVGPVNLTIINEGARRGFAWAALIGLGATLMDVVYCGIAFTGFASLFDNHVLKAGMELFSFFFMLFLGVKFLVSNKVPATTDMGGTSSRLQKQIDERLHPHSAFMIGFVRVMGNPGVLLGWIVFGAYFISHGWVPETGGGKLACVTGVAVGTGLWFFCLSYGASRGHGKFSSRTLLRMQHFSGGGLLALAVGHGSYLVWQMAKHKI